MPVLETQMILGREIRHKVCPPGHYTVEDKSAPEEKEITVFKTAIEVPEKDAPTKIYVADTINTAHLEKRSAGILGKIVKTSYRWTR